MNKNIILYDEIITFAKCLLNTPTRRSGYNEELSRFLDRRYKRYKK